MRLADLGWTDAREAEFAPLRADGLVPGRVAVEHKDAYGLYVDGGEVRATLAGKLRHAAAGGGAAARPAVGDWVAARLPTGDGGAVIHAVLDRTSAFTRKTAGKTAAEQVVAANVDVVLLLVALTEDPNLRRLERYLAVAWESGAQPVVILSKSDLVSDAPQRLAHVRAVAAGVPVLVTSAVTGAGLEAVRSYLGPGRTLALLGPSGVGKSTLANALLGSARQQTADVRDYDGKGRHTTTRRELVPVPGGGLLLDTPGMRELGLWDAGAGLAEAFGEIAALAGACRFRDCTHEQEPGCAVVAAAAAGRLAPDRLASYRKLQAELRYLETQLDTPAGRERKREERAANKALRAQLKRKYEG
jgi:ribosome biogenesis GTPase